MRYLGWLFSAILALLAMLRVVWNPTANRMEKGEGVTIAPSAARTTTGNSGWIDSQGFDDLVLELDVTAASGTTPTLNVTVDTAETAAGGSSRSVAAFAQKTGISNERKSFPGIDNFYRVTWTIAGTTPSFTFSIVGEAS